MREMHIVRSITNICFLSDIVLDEKTCLRIECKLIVLIQNDVMIDMKTGHSFQNAAVEFRNYKNTIEITNRPPRSRLKQENNTTLDMKVAPLASAISHAPSSCEAPSNISLSHLRHSAGLTLEPSWKRGIVAKLISPHRLYRSVSVRVSSMMPIRPLSRGFDDLTTSISL